jgi:NADH-quinone oxidoreductase subunit M
VTLAPLLLLVFWIGLSPEPFMDVMHTSVSHLLKQTSTAATGTFSITSLMIP